MAAENNNYTQKLASEYYPDKTPKYIVNDEIKTEIENRLGTQLPDDYYDFINNFGYGSFNYYVKVFNFFRMNGIEDYFQETQDNKEIMQELKDMKSQLGFDDVISVVENGKIISKTQSSDLRDVSIDNFDEEVRKKIIKCGIGYPYEFYSNGSGLIYWGSTDDHNFFWNYNNDIFTVVLYEDDGGFYEFDMSCTEFLYNFLHEKIIPLYGSDKFIYNEYDE